MSDIDRTEKLIVTLGQRMSALNELFQMIAESLRGIELHLRQMSISSNPAPNYQRPLSEYPTFDWSSPLLQTPQPAPDPSQIWK